MSNHFVGCVSVFQSTNYSKIAFNEFWIDCDLLSSLVDKLFNNTVDEDLVSNLKSMKKLFANTNTKQLQKYLTSREKSYSSSKNQAANNALFFLSSFVVISDIMILLNKTFKITDFRLSNFIVE